MKEELYNKKKIINDPIYGFITLPFDIIFDIIEHPYFQRLRRIKQLGLTHLVYPGALHTRFHHALGAMHITQKAIEVIRSKGHKISKEEEKATLIGILLHDIGHGPFSHALEFSIVKNVTHEDISSIFMRKLNKEFRGKLNLAIKIFEDKYEKPFLHQLISSQLDMDRLDYLKRDSFFTGVSEGVVNSERIISMLNVKDGNLCVDAKGIYSIEKFIVARRLMYWQVYLHKTVISAENLIVNILKRAKELVASTDISASPELSFFLNNAWTKKDFETNEKVLNSFAQLDDFDIVSSIKQWQNHPDKVLSTLSKSMLNRNLFSIELSKTQTLKKNFDQIMAKTMKDLNLSEDEISYFVFEGSILNNAYHPKMDKINLLYRDGSIQDIAEASDQLNILMLSDEVKKYYLCKPKHKMVENLKKQAI